MDNKHTIKIKLSSLSVYLPGDKVKIMIKLIKAKKDDKFMIIYFFINFSSSKFNRYFFLDSCDFLLVFKLNCLILSKNSSKSPMTLAGFPPTIQLSGIDLVTTAPAPIITLLPI